MAIFRKKIDDPLTQRAQQLEQEIAKIEAEIQRLKNFENVRAETRKPYKNSNNCRLFIEGQQDFLEDEQKPVVKKTDHDETSHPKYDLIGEIKRRLGFVKKSESEKSKLIKTLLTGSLQGPPLLKYEQRIARNRFLFVFTIFIIVLIGVLSLLTKAR